MCSSLFRGCVEYKFFNSSQRSVATIFVVKDDQIVFPDFEPVCGTEKNRLHISANVENMSEKAGDEVVQIYVSKGPATQDDALRKLYGFRRIHLGTHQAQRVDFSLDATQLSGPIVGHKSGTWKIA